MPRAAVEEPSTPPPKKRKRSNSSASANEPPIVTFSSPGRTFRRVLKEDSLNDFKASIRSKLRLSEGARLYLAQTKAGHKIELEDDDDFEAFRALGKHDPLLDVEVQIIEGGENRHPPPFASTSNPQRISQPKPISAPTIPPPIERSSPHTEPSSGTMAPAEADVFSALSSIKKKKKKKLIILSSPPEHESDGMTPSALISAAEILEPTTAAPKKRKKKTQQSAPEASPAPDQVDEPEIAEGDDNQATVGPPEPTGGKRKRRKRPKSIAAEEIAPISAVSTSPPLQIGTKGGKTKKRRKPDEGEDDEEPPTNEPEAKKLKLVINPTPTPATIPPPSTQSQKANDILANFYKFNPSFAPRLSQPAQPSPLTTASPAGKTAQKRKKKKEKLLAPLNLTPPPPASQSAHNGDEVEASAETVEPQQTKKVKKKKPKKLLIVEIGPPNQEVESPQLDFNHPLSPPQVPSPALSPPLDSPHRSPPLPRDDPDAFLQPSFRSSKAARASLNALLQRAEAEEASSHQGSDEEDAQQSERSTTPSDIERKRRRKLRASQQQRGYASVSEDEDDENQDQPQIPASDAAHEPLDPHGTKVSLAGEEESNSDRDSPDDEPSDPVAPHARLPSAADEEPNSASTTSVERESLHNIESADGKHLHSQPKSVGGVGGGDVGERSQKFDFPNATISRAKFVKPTNSKLSSEGADIPPINFLNSSPMLSRDAPTRPSAREADRESIDEFSATEGGPTDAAHASAPRPTNDTQPASSRSNHRAPTESPIQASSPWASPNATRPPFSFRTYGSTTSPTQPPTAPILALAPSPIISPKTSSSQALQTRDARARLSASTQPAPSTSKAPSSSANNGAAIKVSSSQIEPSAVPSTPPPTRRSARRAQSVEAKMEPPNSQSVMPHPVDSLATLYEADGYADADASEDDYDGLPSPTSSQFSDLQVLPFTVDSIAWAAEFLPRSRMKKDEMRSFFMYRGIPLGKKSDTRPALVSQAITLMSEHPNYITRLRRKYGFKLSRLSRRLSSIPPPMLEASPSKHLIAPGDYSNRGSPDSRDGQEVGDPDGELPASDRGSEEPKANPQDGDFDDAEVDNEPYDAEQEEESGHLGEENASGSEAETRLALAPAPHSPDVVSPEEQLSDDAGSASDDEDDPANLPLASSTSPATLNRRFSNATPSYPFTPSSQPATFARKSTMSATRPRLSEMTKADIRSSLPRPLASSQPNPSRPSARMRALIDESDEEEADSSDDSEDEKTQLRSVSQIPVSRRAGSSLDIVRGASSFLKNFMPSSQQS
ncbi:hypothetical protein DL93DRAFT_2073656 [Clavulina sp. PMI_390]|nr:hypothetical protein DL93DRAFT_2073656 [Clavulina sp. PMI_390]